MREEEGRDGEGTESRMRETAARESVRDWLAKVMKSMAKVPPVYTYLSKYISNTIEGSSPTSQPIAPLRPNLVNSLRLTQPTADAKAALQQPVPPPELDCAGLGCRVPAGGSMH